MSVKDIGSVNKRLKYIVYSELLKQKFEIFINPLEDAGIDCVIRLNDKIYIDVYIKVRSSMDENWNTFAAMTVMPRENAIYIFYLEKNNSYWVIPSEHLIKISKVKHLGRVTFSVPIEEDDSKQISMKYKNSAGFEHLRNMKTKVH
ncbi:hypothetical protein ACFQZT_16770 [Paenibacillus sp. GCM10027628]|uniref:hypothetical protein n=1 Tax=Paenibacillus sp. GCM10027628 TaxID=3273413 RepID=UPI00362BD4DB